MFVKCYSTKRKMVTKAVIGSRIMALRLVKGLSQEAFGSPFDLSKTALSQIESVSTCPSLESKPWLAAGIK